MSKERARRRAEREREAAIRTAARARADERRARSHARRKRLLGWIPTPHLTPGLLAARRRRELSATICILLALNVLVWVVSPSWAARIGAIMVSVLVAPVLHLMLFRRH